MLKTDKERIVEELAAELGSAETLIVADYRGLTNKQLEALRDQLLPHGARFRIVKNTLTRRAAEQAGAEALLVMLEGPTAIAFIESSGDPAAVAKALAATAKETNVLTLRGGILEGKTLSGDGGRHARDAPADRRPARPARRRDRRAAHPAPRRSSRRRCATCTASSTPASSSSRSRARSSSPPPRRPSRPRRSRHRGGRGTSGCGRGPVGGRACRGKRTGRLGGSRGFRPGTNRRADEAQSEQQEEENGD